MPRLLTGLIAATALVAANAARADVLPYRPGAPLPPAVSSPPVAPDAPFTPAVNGLLAQLLPGDHPSVAQISNAAKLLHGISSTPFGGPTSRCGTIGSNDAPQEGVDVSFDVTNTGRRTGAVVPQVYVGPASSVPAGVQQPDRELAGFARLVLRPRRTRHVVIHLGPGADRDGFGDRRAFQFWDSARQAFVTAPGPRQVWVGDADDAARLHRAASHS